MEDRSIFQLKLSITFNSVYVCMYIEYKEVWLPPDFRDGTYSYDGVK